MKTTFIYALNAPDTGECRYVGKSDRPDVRFYNHVRLAHRTKNHKDCWIVSLLTQGRIPKLEILDEVPRSEWEFWEREYIRVFRAIGFKLTNSAEGGSGGNGRKGIPLTQEHRNKIGESHKGKIMSEEHKQKVREANLGKVYSAETREKRSRAMLGHIFPESRNRKISVARLGMKFSEEHKKHISEGKRGRPGHSHSLESRQKISLARKGRKASPEACHNQRLAQLLYWERKRKEHKDVSA